METRKERIRKLNRIANIYHQLLLKLEDYGMSFQENSEKGLTVVARDLMQSIAVAEDELETIAQVLYTISKDWKKEIGYFYENSVDKIISESIIAANTTNRSSPQADNLNHHSERSHFKVHPSRMKILSESSSENRPKMNVYYDHSLDPRLSKKS